jgi:hypothetical protein
MTIRYDFFVREDGTCYVPPVESEDFTDASECVYQDVGTAFDDVYSVVIEEKLRDRLKVRVVLNFEMREADGEES